MSPGAPACCLHLPRLLSLAPTQLDVNGRTDVFQGLFIVRSATISVSSIVTNATGRKALRLVIGRNAQLSTLSKRLWAPPSSGVLSRATSPSSGMPWVSKSPKTSWVQVSSTAQPQVSSLSLKMLRITFVESVIVNNATAARQITVQSAASSTCVIVQNSGSTPRISPVIATNAAGIAFVRQSSNCTHTKCTVNHYGSESAGPIMTSGDDHTKDELARDSWRRRSQNSGRRSCSCPERRHHGSTWDEEDMGDLYEYDDGYGYECDDADWTPYEYTEGYKSAYRMAGPSEPAGDTSEHQALKTPEVLDGRVCRNQATSFLSNSKLCHHL